MVDEYTLVNKPVRGLFVQSGAKPWGALEFWSAYVLLQLCSIRLLLVLLSPLSGPKQISFPSVYHVDPFVLWPLCVRTRVMLLVGR